MKSTGIVRKIDELGRIVLPKEIRDIIGIETRDPMEIFMDGNQIILQKYQPGCHECKEVDVLLHGQNVKLCSKCIQKINIF